MEPNEKEMEVVRKHNSGKTAWEQKAFYDGYKAALQYSPLITEMLERVNTLKNVGKLGNTGLHKMAHQTITKYKEMFKKGK